MWVESLVTTTQTLWLLQHKAGDPTSIFHELMLCLSTMEYIGVSVYICVYLVSFSQGLWLRHVLEGSILCIYLINIFSYTVFFSLCTQASIVTYLDWFVCSPSPLYCFGYSCLSCAQHRWSWLWSLRSLNPPVNLSQMDLPKAGPGHLVWAYC